jgi:hypothetical protein
VIGHKPFEHPAIVEVIKQRLFDETRHPITEEFPEFFKDGEKLTDSIIAFAATTVCLTCYPLVPLLVTGFQVRAAIQEWNTGTRLPQEFTANAFTEVYLDHIGTLMYIKNKNPKGYDSLLRRLFRIASYVYLFCIKLYT